jgi:hypothetical protein
MPQGWSELSEWRSFDHEYFIFKIKPRDRHLFRIRLSHAADPVLTVVRFRGRSRAAAGTGDTKVCLPVGARSLSRTLQCELKLFSPACWHWV